MFQLYNMTYEEKKSLYESIMMKISKQVKSMLNEADITNGKEQLANIINNWDKLSPEAKNILSSSIDKINNLNKSTANSSAPVQTPKSSQQFNVADAFIEPDTTILKKYVETGNVSKDFKQYSNWALSGLKELETAFKAIRNKKQDSETKSKAEDFIIKSFSLKNEFNESDFNEIFTVHTEKYGDISIFDRQNLDDLNLQIVYNMVKEFRIVQVLLKFIKKCVETDFNNDKYRTIVPLGHDKDLFKKFIEDNLNADTKDKSLYKEIHKTVVILYGDNHHTYKIIEDIKFIDILILLRYCLLSACYERKKLLKH